MNNIKKYNLLGRLCYLGFTALTWYWLILVIYTESSNALNLNFFLPLVLFIVWAFYTSILFSRRLKVSLPARVLIAFSFSVVLLLLILTAALVIVRLTN